jgi:3-deoxy-manno-octulosonate cytidylyltransferase (CMP-KDO synthetase)
MNIVAIIPARMGSSRFPGKPLAPINGTPMIGHVLAGIANCQLLTEIIVATCDQEIVDYVSSIGHRAIMTSDKHERASDRCAEALLTLEDETLKTYDIVVMVQGDEPIVRAEMIEEAVVPMLSDPSILVTNLRAEITSDTEFHDRNCIKVVCDKNGDAIYFSRQPIPSESHGRPGIRFKQVCVIPFRRNYLLTYTSLAPTPLEIAESIDMLRVLEHGAKVRMVPTLYESFSVDTPADLERVAEYMSKG